MATDIAAVPGTQLTELKQTLESIRIERAILETRVELNHLREDAERGIAVSNPGVRLEEAWGDLINTRDYLFDDPSFNVGRGALPISRLDDRYDGRFRPVYETEQELQFIRGAAHLIATAFSSGINVMEILSNYTVGGGFTHEVKAKKDAPQGLAERAQFVIDAFQERNKWKGGLEKEIHGRSREDGEALVGLKPVDGWQTEVNLAEPDQLTQPGDPWELENYLEQVRRQAGSTSTGNQEMSWSYGVHTVKRYASRHLGYAIMFEPTGADWEYYPAEDVRLGRLLGCGTMEMIKRNSPLCAKRGVSDFYPVLRHLEQLEKLYHNTVQGAAIQAAIAYIREHAATSTASQIGGMRSALATDKYQRPVQKGGSQTRYGQRFGPGTIIDTTAGTKFIHGPMGQNDATNHIEVIQAAIRYCGARWAVPEYMISSDASNNNFASILVSGSPFVCAREADQRFYGAKFERIDWVVLENAYYGGKFDSFGLSWPQIKSLLEIELTPASITIADDLKLAQVKAIEAANGALSAETWIKESGRDVETEKKNLAAQQVERAAAAKLMSSTRTTGTEQDGLTSTGAPSTRELHLQGEQKPLAAVTQETVAPGPPVRVGRLGRGIRKQLIEAAAKAPKQPWEFWP